MDLAIMQGQQRPWCQKWLAGSDRNESYMALQLLPFWISLYTRKILFIFYQCAYQNQGKMRLRDTTNIIKPTYLGIGRKKCFYLK